MQSITLWPWIFRFDVDVDDRLSSIHDLAFGIIKMYPLFASHNAPQKTFFFCEASRGIEMFKRFAMTFSVNSYGIVFLPFESFPLFIDVWKQFSE